MLAAGVRRFTTSALRRSHYEDGPGKVLRGKGGSACRGDGGGRGERGQGSREEGARLPVGREGERMGKGARNLPFSVENKWRLLAVMCAFFGSGFAAPFFIVRHQLLKK
ncbi:hypothetical protein ASZ78_002305 [Callipepla squamata]|uniref:Cytochrome c oxidase subunit 7C, mitochondrial n=1 Tax=Callipepla squamata TaxID=9009 RepID=A0A226MQY3_CALSU|nr:hypothetical protein ASZ78_002305 [Callipepla squamata]